MSKYAETFVVLPEHLILLKRANVDWDDCEYGAPCIDPKRPYGNSDVENDIIELIGGVEEISEGTYKFKLFGKEYVLKGYSKSQMDLSYDDELCQTLRKLHEETETVLQIALITGQFKAGRYGKKDKYDYTSWEFIE